MHFRLSMRKLVLFLAIILDSFALQAQQQKLFPGSKNLMAIGVYYYPDQSKTNEWNHDFERIAKLGFEFVQLGAYSWTELELTPDKFDFSWLDTCVRQAANHGLKVVLCTPTAEPPGWLTQLHPEMIITDENGINGLPGSGLYVNETNELFENFATRIIKELAKKYGKDNRIIGWQLDNEPHIGTLYDYSETSQAGFRKWLMQKYSSLPALNSAWGKIHDTIFNDFQQIRIPNNNEISRRTNPIILLDFLRYNSDAVASFLHYQTKTLRQNINPLQWITTNFSIIKFLPVINPFKNKKDLSFVSHTISQVNNNLNDTIIDPVFRITDGLGFSLSAEINKSVKGSTGILELQSAQADEGRREKGNVRMGVWHAYALGEKFVCTYLYRQAPHESKLNFKSIMQLNGISLTHEASEFIQAMEEIKGLKRQFRKDYEIPSELASRKTIFLWQPDNFCNLDSGTQSLNQETWHNYLTYYSICKTMGATVSFLQETDNFDPEKFPFLIAPAFHLLDSNLIIKWIHYVKEGGNLILSSGTGQYDKNGGVPESAWKQSFQQLIGAEVTYSDNIYSEAKSIVNAGDSSYLCLGRSDSLQPDLGTRVLAYRYDRDNERRATIITRKQGKGTVTYIAVSTQGGKLEKQIIRNIYSENNARILNNPYNVFTEFRDGFWITVNYSSQVFDVPIPEKAQILLGTKKLPPAGVVVWKE
jgi:beta-galactosidase